MTFSHLMTKEFAINWHFQDINVLYKMLIANIRVSSKEKNDIVASEHRRCRPAYTQELDVDFVLYLYTLYEVEERTVTPLLLKILGESYLYCSAYKHVCICFE